MSSIEVHQFLPSFAGRDAIGAHTLEVRNVLRGLGVESEIYAGESRDVVRGSCRPHETFSPRRGAGATLLVYQAATGSPVGDFVLGRPERKLVNYHNITPGHFFRPWLPHVAVEVEQGRRQLADLAPVCELGIAVSAYNEAELVAAGYARTEVAPIIVDPAVFDRTVDPSVLARLEAAKGAGGSDWLFVGRIAPNKAQHDLVAAFAIYREVYDPRARLHLVGGFTPGYVDAVVSVVEHLGLRDAVDLAGSVPDGALAAYYRAADVFVCASDHEGFCVPLLEAMHHRLPIVAFAAAAVPETLGAAGLVVTDKAPASLAAAVHRVCVDDALRRALVAAGEARLDDFAPERTRAAYRSIFERVLAEVEGSVAAGAPGT